MNRRDFLRTGLLGAAATAASGTLFAACGTSSGKKRNIPALKISFQEGTAIGETLEQKFDYMASLGVAGFEPHGKNLLKQSSEIQRLAKERNIQISAVCAGFEGFILAEDPEVKAKFDATFRELLVAAGEVGSIGVIMVPAFLRQLPCMPHTAETRAYLVDQLRELGEFALQHNTTVILEPLNRREAHYLRLVADAASICRDTNSEGVRCMGDFWHMTHEETSDYGAFFSGGKYLQHVHIASRGNRNMPGEDGELDCYVDGFRALQEMDYKGFVSFECRSQGSQETTVPAAVELMRKQWQEAAG